jgi:hypothetical protein
MGQEAGPQKKRTFSKSEGGASKFGGKPRDGGKPGKPRGEGKPQGKPFPKKGGEGFKKRDAKAQTKGGDDESRGGKF